LHSIRVEVSVKTVRMLLVIVACASLGSAATAAKVEVAVRVTPSVSVAPATVRVVVTIEPDADNRQLELVADSGSFYTSSTVQLEGGDAPRLQTFEFKEMPAGNYEVSARVLQKNGQTREATADYTVLQ
jgi:hypothetical protein